MLKRFKNQLANLSGCVDNNEYKLYSNKLRIKLYLLAVVFLIFAIVGLVFTIVLIKKAIDVYNDYDGLMLEEGETFEYVGNILSPVLLFIPSVLLAFVGIRLLLMAIKIPKTMEEIKTSDSAVKQDEYLHHKKIKCRKCEYPNDSHSEYCEKCGTKLD